VTEPRGTGSRARPIGLAGSSERPSTSERGFRYPRAFGTLTARTEGRPAAWLVKQSDGGLGAPHVDPAYRGKGLGGLASAGMHEEAEMRDPEIAGRHRGGNLWKYSRRISVGDRLLWSSGKDGRQAGKHGGSGSMWPSIVRRACRMVDDALRIGSEHRPESQKSQPPTKEDEGRDSTGPATNDSVCLGFRVESITSAMRFPMDDVVRIPILLPGGFPASRERRAIHEPSSARHPCRPPESRPPKT
jgi:hypothetical protein